MFSLVIALSLSAVPSVLAETRRGQEGQLELQSGVLSAPLEGDLVESARRFVLSRRAELMLSPPSSIDSGTPFATRFGGSIHFAQTVNGIEVYGAKVVVTVDASRRVVRLASSVRPFSHLATRFALSPEQALKAAAAELEGATLRPDGAPYGGTKRTFFRVGDALHAGYLVRLVHVRPDQNWYAGVDATDGTVLFLQNRVHHADDAHVYRSSPGSAGVGVTPTVPVVLSHLAAQRDGGFLVGDQISVYNCCPTEGCNPNGQAKRAKGEIQTFNGTVRYDLAICDRRQRATNDPAVHASGDYVYAPVDPPRSPTVSAADPADSDEFAEVHAFYHVNQVYDFVRQLSANGPTHLPTFEMRDERRGKKPAVWTNLTMPDLYSAQESPEGVLVGNALAREDNAAFLPVEGMEALLLPEYALDVDTLLIYQGDKADFAYDAPVLWHEFGHGVIYSTAAFEFGVVLDERSALDVAGALHEGVADIIAASFGKDGRVGAYVGPRIGSGNAIRDISEPLTCPDSLWGESHQDSRFFSGAVWAARQQFLGSDDRRTFDAAFYAALVSMAPNTTFDTAASAIVQQVVAAFPDVPDARERMEAIFKQRGVIGCSKVVDATNGPWRRDVYIVPGTHALGLADGSRVPGPYQIKISVPHGAKSVSIRAPYRTFGQNPTVRMALLAKADAPVTFTRSGNSLTDDADVAVTPTLEGQVMKATAPILVPCGGELYFTIANTSRRDRLLTDLELSFERADGCPEVPPARVDAHPNGPPGPVKAPAVGEGSVASGPPSGCGCGSAASLLPALGALVVIGRRRARSGR